MVVSWKCLAPKSPHGIPCFPTGAPRRDDLPDAHPLQSPVRWHLGWAWDRLYPLHAEGCGSKSRPQWDPEPLLRLQRGAEGDPREGQEERVTGYTLVQPHCRNLPLQVVGQPP